MRSTDLPSACSLVAAALGTTGRGLTLPPRGPDRSQVPLLLYGSVLACLMLWAGLMTYRQYLQQLPLRWSSIYHDRNAHYQAALGIACELRQGHLLQALRDLDAASVAWPLLHPLLLGLVLAVTGPLPEAAVLPGVLGWLTAGALAFWLVQRLLRGPAGLLGGLLAAALLLSSPALRVMATDVMLESLGLALTLAVLVAYARWVESPSTRRAAWLGGLLAALFLHKYNYWGLTIVALIAHQIGWQAPSAKRCLSIVLAALPERKWLYRQLTHPLHYLILALLVVSGVIWYLQGVYLGLGPWHFEIHRPRLLIETAYLLFLVRLLGWWFRSGRRAVQRHAGEAWRTLIEWAGLPVLVWLALPFRLHYFVWYAGPGNNPGVLQLSWLQKLQFYAGGIASNYYLHRWLLVGSVGLAVIGLVGLLAQRGGRPWRWAPVLFLFAAASLTLLHPNAQIRFVHTWLPLLWVLSGVGLATLLNLLRHTFQRLGAGLSVGMWLVQALMVGIILGGLGAAVAQPPQVHPWFGRGYGTPSDSLRELYDVYLSQLDGQRPTAVLCNLPEASWRWPFLERFGHKNNLHHNLREIGVFDPVSLQDAQRWLAATGVEVIVYVEIPPTSPLYEPPPHRHDNTAILTALYNQDRFHAVRQIPVRNLGTIYIWQRS